MFGPGQRIDADGAQGERLLTRVKDLPDFDLHLCVASFVMSGQHAGLDNCIKHAHVSQKPEICLNVYRRGARNPSYRNCVLCYRVQMLFLAFSPCSDIFLRTHICIKRSLDAAAEQV